MNKKKCTLLCYLVALNFTISYSSSAAPTPTDGSTAEQSKDNLPAAAALSNPTEQNIKALAKALERDQEDTLSRKALETLAEYGNPCARNEVYRLGIWEKPPTPKEEYICNSFEDYLKKKDDIEKYNQTVGTKSNFNESTIDDAVKQLKFPVVYERIGPMIDKEKLRYFPKERRQKIIGWKISIAPRFSSFKTVLGEVEKLYPNNPNNTKQPGKFCFYYTYAANAETIRKRYYAQQPVKGSFVLFFRSDTLAAETVKALDDAFKAKGLSREDFLYIDDHFQVGETGGLYVKLHEGENMALRDKDGNNVIISPSLYNNNSYIKARGNNSNANTNTYEHPFDNLKNRGIIVPKKVSKIINNPKYNGIIPPIAGIGEPREIKEVVADAPLDEHPPATPETPKEAAADNSSAAPLDQEHPPATPEEAAADNSIAAPLDSDLLKTTLEMPTKENVYKLAQAIEQDGQDVETTYNAARVILETLGDDGNIAAIEKLYELKIWKHPPADLFGKIKLAESKEAEWQDGNPNEHKLYSSNETLDKKFDDMSEKTYPSLKASFTASYLKYPIKNPSVSPCAIEYTGNMTHPSRFFLYLLPEWRNQNNLGWKMHISARISSATEIAEIVLPYLGKEKIYYKVLASIPIIRMVYNTARYGNSALPASFSQRGKFITIYPSSDKEANEIAKHLDSEFKRARLRREDFVYVNGDLQVGDTGGIFTRLACYSHDFDMERGHLNLGPKTLLSYLQGISFLPLPSSGKDILQADKQKRASDKRGFPICLGRNYAEILAAVKELSQKSGKSEILDYEHPFSLGLKHRGQDMPKKILDMLQCIGDEPDMDAFRDSVYLRPISK